MFNPCSPCLNSKGIILKEFAPEGKTVTGGYYLEVMKRLWARILRVRPEYRDHGSWRLLHDNAPSHKALVVREFLASKGIVELNHPPYSPDLSPCDYFFFSKLKLALKGTSFCEMKDIQKASTDFLGTVSRQGFQQCFKRLYDRSNKCINAYGMSFE